MSKFQEQYDSVLWNSWEIKYTPSKKQYSFGYKSLVAAGADISRLANHLLDHRFTQKIEPNLETSQQLDDDSEDRPSLADEVRVAYFRKAHYEFEASHGTVTCK